MTRGQLALVTGASRGLGRALTEHLSAAGVRVLADARHADDLIAALDRLPGVTAVPGDVTEPAHRAELARLAAAGGGLDIVVNNASALGPSPLPALAELDPDALIEVLAVNTVAPLALLQALLPHLNPGARVLNVSSDAAVEAYPGWGGYGASKAALDQLSAVLAAEQPGLRVYAVDPGDMRTAMHQAAFPGEDISDRPRPEDVVPALRPLLAGALPSGRYRATDLAAQAPYRSDVSAPDADPRTADLAAPDADPRTPDLAAPDRAADQAADPRVTGTGAVAR
jgi:NAD(P)-dependent dehydrogenase (short-subunit alcohol dehydrogenase family)